MSQLPTKVVTTDLKTVRKIDKIIEKRDGTVFKKFEKVNRSLTDIYAEMLYTKNGFHNGEKCRFRFLGSSIEFGFQIINIMRRNGCLISDFVFQFENIHFDKDNKDVEMPSLSFEAHELVPMELMFHASERFKNSVNSKPSVN